jgi:thioredoxin 1
MTLVHFTETSLQEHISAGAGVMLVDFWAHWCGPCRRLAPIIARLAEEFAGSATIGTIDVEEHPQVAVRYHVFGLPTVAIFRNDTLIQRIIGVRAERHYRTVLHAILTTS